MGGKGRKGYGGKGNEKGKSGGKDGIGGGHGSQPDAFDSESIASADDFVYSYHKVEFASDGTAKLWFVEVHRTGWQEWRLDCNNLCIDTDYHAAWPSNFHPVWECCRRCQLTFHTMYYFTHGIHQGLMLKTPS